MVHCVHGGVRVESVQRWNGDWSMKLAGTLLPEVRQIPFKGPQGLLSQVGLLLSCHVDLHFRVVHRQCGSHPATAILPESSLLRVASANLRCSVTSVCGSAPGSLSPDETPTCEQPSDRRATTAKRWGPRAKCSMSWSASSRNLAYDRMRRPTARSRIETERTLRGLSESLFRGRDSPALLLVRRPWSSTIPRNPDVLISASAVKNPR